MYSALLVLGELRCRELIEAMYADKLDGGPLWTNVAVHLTKERLNKKLAALGQRITCGRGRNSYYKLENHHG